jgi:UDP-N-acetylmuramate: L-alanyl-gamma-D-glutamyl-meso-diaminopimelate ligase
MHIHILGICGTFMGGLAVLARQLGHEVSGSDANVYPPMRSQLEAQGIRLCEGYDPEHLQPAPDLVVIGNALSRGNPAVEQVLARGLPYTSGPQWLAEHVLQDRWVLGVAGTHGKTTTASLLAWILEANDLQPGFLIGGIPVNFGVSARLGETPFFVVEADEYDTAFFDKRSKFVHYRPRTLILNNLEYDHADIFPDLAAIERQFHHLIRTVPGNGLILRNLDDPNLGRVLEQGCWTPVETFAVQAGADWRAVPSRPDLSRFEVWLGDALQGEVDWTLMGEHNMANALAAIAAARHAGVPARLACQSLHDFRGIKRRMEVRGEVAGITVYDDFAHHPTAIATTLAGLRRQVGDAPIVAILEPRSNTMRRGVHVDALAASLQGADQVFLYRPGEIEWDMTAIIQALDGKAHCFDSTDAIIEAVVQQAPAGSHILIMSNGGFEDIHARLLHALPGRHS